MDESVLRAIGTSYGYVEINNEQYRINRCVDCHVPLINAHHYLHMHDVRHSSVTQALCTFVDADRPHLALCIERAGHETNKYVVHGHIYVYMH